MDDTDEDSVDVFVVEPDVVADEVAELDSESD